MANYKKKDYTLTPEQLEAKKQLQTELIDRAKGKTIENFCSYVDRCVMLPNYSTRNVSLIEAQCSDAKYVQSFKKWKDEGINVNKGEKAMQVFVPVEKYHFINDKGVEVAKTFGSLSANEKKDISQGNIDHTCSTTFHLKAAAFDISQTNADVKEYMREKHNIEDNEVMNLLENYCANSGIEVKYSNILVEALGKAQYTRETGERKLIALMPSLPITEQIQVFFHEIGHVQLEHYKNDAGDSEQKEFEAELFSYVMTKKLDLESADKTAKYIQMCSSKFIEKDDTVIDKSLNKILKLADKVTEALNTLQNEQLQDEENTR